MNRFMSITGVALAAGIFSMSALAGQDQTGNGAPSGPHYNLNLIGVPDKDGDGLNGNGHRIFVSLTGRTNIWLFNSDDPGGSGGFRVLDYNGTDGDAAFELPNPDPDCDGTTEYSVFARALGNSGKATVTTCAEDKTDSTTFYCSTGASNILVMDRNEKNGKSSFDNVSRELLYVSFDGGKRYPLFGDDNFNYYWDYDNEGLRIAQLRFYEIETVVDPDQNNVDCEFPDL